MGEQDQNSAAGPDLTSTAVRIASGAALFGAWLYLAAIGKADVASLVEFIKYALPLLVGHAITRGSKT